MRKLLPLIALSLASSLGAVAPVSQTLGNVQVTVEEGSITEIALRALREEYTEEWLERYAQKPMLFAEAYSLLLHDLLPMDGIIAGEERGNSVKVIDQATGAVLSLSFRSGRLSAVTPLSLPDIHPGEWEEAVEDISPLSEGTEAEAYVEEEPPIELPGPVDPGIPYLYEIRFPSGT